MKKIVMSEIPFMTHPYGRHWDQPKRENILVDDKHALMSEDAFKLLNEYSLSIPTGAYEGKMWKRKGDSGKWLLCWYDVGLTPETVSVKTREIIIV